MAKKEFTDNKDTKHGAIKEVPKEWVASEKEIQQAQEKYRSKFKEEKERLKKKK